MKVEILAIDLAKRVFQVHGGNLAGRLLVKRRLTRDKLTAFLAQIPKCIVAMEACSTSHYWARFCLSMGHEVRLVPAQHVRPYVKSQKNDVADAAAIFELDLVVSALALQFVNDLPGTLVQIRRALKPDGLFLAAMIGGESLIELREAFAQAESEMEGGVSPRVAPFADLRDLGALLQRAGFALPVTDIDRVTVRYATPLALMHDLRRMGAANALTERRRTPLRRATLRRLFEIYAERFADPDGRIRATFEIVWLSGWAPHESQQKPLQPGSAKTRLADALRTVEISTGEKAGG